MVEVTQRGVTYQSYIATTPLGKFRISPEGRHEGTSSGWVVDKGGVGPWEQFIPQKFRCPTANRDFWGFDPLPWIQMVKHLMSHQLYAAQERPLPMPSVLSPDDEWEAQAVRVMQHQDSEVEGQEGSRCPPWR